MKYLVVYCMILFLFSCQITDIESDVKPLEKRVLWSRALSDRGYLWDHGMHETGLLCVAQFDSGYGLVMMDYNTSDIFYKNNLFLREGYYTTSYRYQNNLLIPEGNDMISINMDKGEKNWETSLNNTFAYQRQTITGYKSNYYTVRSPRESIVSVLYEGNLSSGNAKEFYHPELTIPDDFEGFYLGGVDKVAYYKNSNGDNMLLIHMVYFGESDWGIDWIKTYNLDTRQFVLDSIPVYHGQVSWPPVFEDDYAYLGMSYGTIAKMDLTTGDTLWQKRYDRYLNTNEMLIVEDDLFFLTDGAYGLLHSVDKNTGDINWTTRTKAGASMSNMRFYKGYIYFTSRNSAGLHAFDINTGREVWYKKPPGDNEGFARTCYLKEGVGDEKGRLYVRSGSHMYCYETIN